MLERDTLSIAESACNDMEWVFFRHLSRRRGSFLRCRFGVIGKYCQRVIAAIIALR
jgi:hypothetical protein